MGNLHTRALDTNQDSHEDDDNDEDVERYIRPIALDNKVLQRLKQHDPTLTHLSVKFGCDNTGEYIFNSIDWEEDGYCIANNKHLKKLIITYGQRVEYTLGGARKKLTY